MHTGFSIAASCGKSSNYEEFHLVLLLWLTRLTSCLQAIRIPSEQQGTMKLEPTGRLFGVVYLVRILLGSPLKYSSTL